MEIYSNPNFDMKNLGKHQKDYIKSNSKIVELIKKVKFKYFVKLRKEYGLTAGAVNNLGFI